MATKYTLRGTSETGVSALYPNGREYSRKDAAIKAGETAGGAFQVTTSTGAVVHEFTPEAPAAGATPKKEKTVAKTTAPTEPEAPAKETPTLDVEFEGLGKYYVGSAGLHGAEVIGAVYEITATRTGTTIHLFGDETSCTTVATQLQTLWPAAKLAHRDWRKEDKTYSEIDKSRKNKEANEQRFAMETAWFVAFMDGAADALADTVKRKGGAYKTGVKAIQDPAPVAAEDDLI